MSNQYMKPILIAVLSILIVYFAIRFKPTETFTDIPDDYESRIFQICQLGYQQMGFSTFQECIDSNRSLLEDADKKQIFAQVVMDDKIYKCFSENLRNARNINQCLPKSIPQLFTFKNGYMAAASTSQFDERMKPFDPNSNLLGSLLKKSVVWQKTVLDDTNWAQINQLIKEQSAEDLPLDVAILRFMKQNTAVSNDILTDRFPETSTTRSTFLTPHYEDMTFDDRLKSLCGMEANILSKLWTTKTDAKPIVSACHNKAIMDNPVIRSLLQPIIMNNDVWGCLVNNSKIDGDPWYCLLLYFQSHPDRYRDLMNAVKNVADQSASHASPTNLLTAPQTDPFSDQSSSFRNRFEHGVNLSGTDTLNRNPDGSVELVSSTPRSGNVSRHKFKDMTSLHKWQQSDVENSTSKSIDPILDRRICQAPTQSQNECISLCLEKGDAANVHDGHLKTASENDADNVLMKLTSAEQKLGEAVRQQQKYQEALEACRRESSRRQHSVLSTESRKLSLEKEIERYKKQIEAQMNIIKQCGFTYRLPQEWAMPRPPVCIGQPVKRPDPVADSSSLLTSALVSANTGKFSL